MSDGFDPADFIAGFIAETEEHLASANANLLAVEAAAAQNQPTPRQIRELFRSFHTVKGLAAMVGVEPIVDLAHAMESVLREADAAAARLPPEAVELLLKAVRAIETRVHALGKGQPVAAASAKLLDALNGLRQETTPALPREGATSLAPELWNKLAPADRVELTQGLAAGRRAFVLRFVPSVEQAAAGVTITSIREKAATVAEVVKVVPQSVAATADAPPGLAFALLLLADTDGTALAQALGVAAGALTPVLPAPSPPAVAIDDSLADEGLSEDEQQRRGVVRVDVARLDDALERLSALVVTQFRLARTLAAMRAAGADVRELSHVVAENGRQLRDLRASIMRARMVSVAELLERIPLLVRGLSRATGKDVRLVLATGNAELDKAVAERIFPAVVHLVRNAVDHAIEAPGRPARRREAGIGAADRRLPRTVRQPAGAHGDRRRPRGRCRRGRARGPGRPCPRRTRRCWTCWRGPGCRRKPRSPPPAGAASGMDVVRRIAVDELRGELSMRTTPGQGTTFALRIPLSITIVDAFSFVCGGADVRRPGGDGRGDSGAGARAHRPRARSPPHAARRRRPPPRAARDGDDAAPGRGRARACACDDLLGLEAQRGRAPARPSWCGARASPSPSRSTACWASKRSSCARWRTAWSRCRASSGTTDLGDGRPTLVLDLLAIGEQLLAASTGAPA